MSSLNKVQLIGRLGKDPEVKHTNDNVPVAKFSLATTETYKDKSGQKQETTEWHNIVCWRNLAEIAERYLTKGKQVYIEGKIKTRSWDDKDGVKKYITEIVADNFIMLDKKESSEHHSENASQKSFETAPAENTSVPEDDLPF
jgi:single-strand DNA-binding protein